MDYPWYELIESSNEITQGDILKNCPVPILSSVENLQTGESIDAKIEVIDGIILTQACDIENKKVDNIVLCSITSKEEFEKTRLDSGFGRSRIKSDINSIIAGRQNAYHIINNFKSDDFSQDYYIINFKDIFSIPVELAQKIASENGKRLRLCPPYREHLSQAFARYFMRVGLPINISIEE